VQGVAEHKQPNRERIVAAANRLFYVKGYNQTSFGDVADELGISPHTIRDHLKHLYRKTGTKGRNELLGLISRSN